MLTYTFEKGGGVSLYEQLYRHIKSDILSGVLVAGGETAQQAGAGGPSGGQRYHGEKRL